MMNTCENCKYSEPMCGRLACMGQKYAPYVRPTDTCDSWKPKKETEYDRIHAMSVEELAKFFGTLPCCPPGDDLEEMCYPNDSCEGTDLKVKCWNNWLKQEVSS